MSRARLGRFLLARSQFAASNLSRRKQRNLGCALHSPLLFGSLNLRIVFYRNCRAATIYGGRERFAERTAMLDVDCTLKCNKSAPTMSDQKPINPNKVSSSSCRSQSVDSARQLIKLFRTINRARSENVSAPAPRCASGVCMRRCYNLCSP